MNVLWVLIALGVVWWIAHVWEDAGEAEGELRATTGAEPGRGWQVVVSGVSRVVLIVGVAVVGFVVQFGPWMLLDRLVPEDRGRAEAVCRPRAAPPGSGPSVTAARALIKETSDPFCLEDAAAEIERMRLQP